MLREYYEEPALESSVVLLNKFMDRIFSKLTQNEFKEIEGLISEVLPNVKQLYRNYSCIVVTPKQAYDIKLKLLEKEKFDILDKLLLERDMHAFLGSCKKMFSEGYHDVSLFIDYGILVKQGYLRKDEGIYKYIKTWLEKYKSRYFRHINKVQKFDLSLFLYGEIDESFTKTDRVRYFSELDKQYKEKVSSYEKSTDIDAKVFIAKDFEKTEKLAEAIEKFGEVLYYKPAREGFARLLGKCLESCDRDIVTKYFYHIQEYGLFDSMFFKSVFEKLRDLDAKKAKSFYEILSEKREPKDYFCLAVEYQLKQLGYWGISDNKGQASNSEWVDYFNVKEQMTRLKKYGTESIFKRSGIIETLSKTPIYHKIPDLKDPDAKDFYDCETDMGQGFKLKHVIEKIHVLLNFYPMFDRAIKSISSFKGEIYQYKDYEYVLLLGYSGSGKSHLFVSLKSEKKLTLEQIQENPKVNNDEYSNGSDLLDFYFDHTNKVCYIDSIGINDRNCESLNSKSCAIFASVMFFLQDIRKRISKICIFMTNDEGNVLIDFLRKVEQYYKISMGKDIKLVIPYNVIIGDKFKERYKKLASRNPKTNPELNLEFIGEISKLLQNNCFFKIEKSKEIDTEKFKTWIVDNKTKEQNENKSEECKIDFMSFMHHMDYYLNAISYVFNSLPLIRQRYQDYRYEQHKEFEKEAKEKSKIPGIIQDIRANIKELENAIKQGYRKIDKLKKSAQIYKLNKDLFKCIVEKFKPNRKKAEIIKRISKSHNCKGDFSINSKDLNALFGPDKKDELYNAIVKDGPNFYENSHSFNLNIKQKCLIPQVYNYHILNIEKFNVVEKDSTIEITMKGGTRTIPATNATDTNKIPEIFNYRKHASDVKCIINKTSSVVRIITLIKREDFYKEKLKETEDQVKKNEMLLEDRKVNLKALEEKKEDGYCSEDYLEKRGTADRFKIVKQQIENSVKEIYLDRFFDLFSKADEIFHLPGFFQLDSFRMAKMAYVLNGSCKTFSRYKLFKSIFGLENEDHYEKILQEFMAKEDNINAYRDSFKEAIISFINYKDIYPGQDEDPEEFIIKERSYKELIDYFYESSCQNEKIFDEDCKEEVREELGKYIKGDKKEYFRTSVVKDIVKNIIIESRSKLYGDSKLYTYIKSTYVNLVEIFSIFLVKRIKCQQDANENTRKDATNSSDPDSYISEESEEINERVNGMYEKLFIKNNLIVMARCVSSVDLLKHFADSTKQKIEIVPQMPEKTSIKKGITYIKIGSIIDAKGNDLSYEKF